MKNKTNVFYSKYIKRAFDIVISALVLILLSWLYLLLIIIVRVKLGKHVFFIQERPGKDEKIFKLYKFRTMRDLYDESGNPLPDEKRLTNFGRKLRNTSLDELPEFWNILKGDMSFVGPRPWLVSYIPLYTTKQHRRHDVRPGLTGWAQVHGRNSASWDERIKLDLYYVENISFWLDVKTVILTIIPFIRHEGITSKTSETCEKFEGSSALIK